ncbi:SpoIIE family protein phosphatase [Oxynema sp. CENA135]|uniref:SpoIIE family protein phosphatase n=1 Tax=Oxynema aestuarii AP17 TaxID=2064643 RepID=A0A6H1TUY2_9CYAN|nr:MULTISPECIES: SpoIIE family protein phosphatase [Oxynema]MBK4729092.1 SpoIIE family protein phosphatase [Oxynema sp. CENA135]QIZ70361.1 SpoIIE family protein phosphatase [Oxynema aestuarii AP17]RMH71443.1 MAG: response regulator [Cyanobacteria bacterium J007]
MSRGKGSKLKLMVVDDEIDNLDLLYRTFRREFDVYRADSAFSALETLDKNGEMAVIISDQRMPEMNGTEFLSKTVERFPDTIRILLTGYTDVEDLVEAINSGQVFKYITKPWNPEELKAVVNQASETYQVLKQRTNELNRTLRRESLFNGVMSAIRESLDYRSMLQTIVETVGENFQATGCIVRPVEGDRLTPEIFSYQDANASNPVEPEILEPTIAAVLETRQTQVLQEDNGGNGSTRLGVPLIYQKDLLAVMSLYQDGRGNNWSPEDIQLIELVGEQAALALSQAKLYQRSQEQAEQMLAELEVARQIQTNLLRQSWPDLDSAKIQACCFPARAVGGDFFEVYIHSQGDIWLAVGDVSGKGVPAALFMASAISVMRRELAQEVSPMPEDVMKNLNSALSDDLISNNCFITMVLARYTPSTRQLAYANAGHIYPLVWSQTALAEKLAVEPNFLKDRGIPVGILPMWKGKAGSLELNPGDVFLLTSDGLTEATITHPDSSLDGVQAGEMIQQEGLWKLIANENVPLDLNDLLARIRDLAHEQEDDQTILSLEVL